MEIDKFYLSKNSCFPDQIFRIIEIEDSYRWDKPDRILTVERYAYIGFKWKYISTDKEWESTNCCGKEIPIQNKENGIYVKKY